MENEKEGNGFLEILTTSAKISLSMEDIKDRWLLI